MVSRRLEAARVAHKGTCTWILTHQSYNNWLSEPHGLLWIKGNPGAGKSTVMAYLYRTYQTMQVQTDDVVMSFSFHARGSLLQQSKIGMFRTLLYQLYKSSAMVRPSILSAFEDSIETFGDVGLDWNWYIAQLEELFTNAIV
jgi:ABC-type molybdenum transport system ATPase subunit/photorepair protein PhrA